MGPAKVQDQSKKCSRHWRGISTPLGVPVLPEVKMIYWVWSGARAALEGASAAGDVATAWICWGGTIPSRGSGGSWVQSTAGGDTACKIPWSRLWGMEQSTGQ